MKIMVLISSHKFSRDGQKKFPIIVKLLISIDRKLGEDEAAETIELANKVIKKYPELMVGLDVSGDPNCGHHSWIVRVMEEARKRKFNISCHLPEVGLLLLLEILEIPIPLRTNF